MAGPGDRRSPRTRAFPFRDIRVHQKKQKKNLSILRAGDHQVGTSFIFSSLLQNPRGSLTNRFARHPSIFAIFLTLFPCAGHAGDAPGSLQTRPLRVLDSWYTEQRPRALVARGGAALCAEWQPLFSISPGRPHAFGGNVPPA